MIKCSAPFGSLREAYSKQQQQRDSSSSRSSLSSTDRRPLSPMSTTMASSHDQRSTTPLSPALSNQTFTYATFDSSQRTISPAPSESRDNKRLDILCKTIYHCFNKAINNIKYNKLIFGCVMIEWHQCTQRKHRRICSGILTLMPDK